MALPTLTHTSQIISEDSFGIKADASGLVFVNQGTTKAYISIDNVRLNVDAGDRYVLGFVVPVEMLTVFDVSFDTGVGEIIIIREKYKHGNP